MPRKISDIYTEHKVIPNLQDHMIRVAAVASLICDNMNFSIPKDDIVIACLFHDMGNIIKYDFVFYPKVFEPEGVPYWQNIKEEFIKKYGTNEHHANVLIAREIGLNDDVTDMINRFDFLRAREWAETDNFMYKIINYADWRVGPLSVMSFDERMEEARKRYEGKPDSLPTGERQKLREFGKEVEKQIFAKCKIKPEDINDETAMPIILELKNFVLK